MTSLKLIIFRVAFVLKSNHCVIVYFIIIQTKKMIIRNALKTADSNAESTANVTLILRKISHQSYVTLRIPH